jgi:acetyltransferase-like isoleucine patch superfamily enzyme
MIVSMDGVKIGEAVLTGGGCYISAGAYHFEDIGKAVMDQGMYSKGPIRIEDQVWIGTSVVVLDGVTIGRGAVLGACSLVNKDIAKNVVSFGVPAKAHKYRNSY